MQVSTTSGQVNFLTPPLAAAQQAAADAQLYAAALAGLPSAADFEPVLIATIVSTIATVASTIATVASTAVGIAGLVKDSDGNPVQDVLEIEILNNTALSVIPYGYTPSSCDFTEIAQPLVPTSTDSFLLTSGSVGTFDAKTNLTLNFLVGSSNTDTVEVDLALSYQSDASDDLWAWVPTMTIAGQSQSFPLGLQLGGAQFLGASGFPSFSVYVTPVESATPSRPT